MNGRQSNLNNSAFLGLDLSLSGSPIIPVGTNNIDTLNSNGANIVQTPKKVNRPSSASSSRSYILPRTVLKIKIILFEIILILNKISEIDRKFSEKNRYNC